MTRPRKTTWSGSRIHYRLWMICHRKKICGPRGRFDEINVFSHCSSIFLSIWTRLSYPTMCFYEQEGSRGVKCCTLFCCHGSFNKTWIYGGAEACHWIPPVCRIEPCASNCSINCAFAAAKLRTAAICPTSYIMKNFPGLAHMIQPWICPSKCWLPPSEQC
eukprot:SAG31_NODE_1834_length_7135_cov_6.903923_8_plen_161_part_00